MVIFHSCTCQRVPKGIQYLSGWLDIEAAADPACGLADACLKPGGRDEVRLVEAAVKQCLALSRQKNDMEWI